MKIFKDDIYNLRTLVFKIYPVQIGIALLSSMNSIINGIISGNVLGSSALAAIGLCAPVTNIHWFFVNILVLGGTTLIGNQLGRGKINSIKSTYSLLMVSLIVVGIFNLVMVAIFSQQISYLLGANDDIVDVVIQYPRGMSLIYPFSGILSLFYSLITFEYKPYMPIISTCVNIASNSAFVFIFLGILQLPIYFVGIASFISQIFSIVVFLPYFLSKKCKFKFAIKNICLCDLKLILQTGIPASSISLFLSFRAIVINYLLSKYVGSLALSAIAIEESVACFAGVLTTSIGDLILRVNSYFYGEKDQRSLVKFTECTITWCFCVVFITNLIIVVFAGQISSLYVKDASVIEIAKLMIYAFSVGQLLCVFAFSIIQTYQAQNFKIVFILNLLCCFLVPTVTALFLIPTIGLYGICATLVSGEIITLLVICIYSIFKTKCVRVSFKNILTLGQEYTIKKSDLYDASIVNIKELSKIIENLTKFYERKNFTKHNINTIILCIEEFIVDKFQENNQKTVIDIRVISSDKENYIRLRDNCKNSSLFEFFEEDKQSKNKRKIKNPIGYEIITNFSSKIEYKQIFKMNTTIIRFDQS